MSHLWTQTGAPQGALDHHAVLRVARVELGERSNRISERMRQMENNFDSTIHVCSYHELSAVIEVDGESFHFDFSDRFGPLVTTKAGRECKEPDPKHKFWRAITLWEKQGKRVTGGRAIWEYPPPDKLLRLGGKNYCEDTPDNRKKFAAYIVGTEEIDADD